MSDRQSGENNEGVRRSVKNKKMDSLAELQIDSKRLIDMTIGRGPTPEVMHPIFDIKIEQIPNQPLLFRQRDNNSLSSQYISI
jgi:hypothetical protein